MKDGDIVRELAGYDVGKQLAVVKKHGGRERLDAFMRGEFVLVEKSRVSSVNGGVNFIAPVPQIPDAKLFLQEMAEFYGEVYGISKMPEVILPNVVEGFSWGLILQHESQCIYVTKNDLKSFGNYFSGFPKLAEYDMDIITKSVRDANKPYAIWLRDRIEADQEFEGKSYDSLQKLGINGITLAERIRLERWFFWRTKKYLDQSTVTICSGSCTSEGFVPLVKAGNYVYFVKHDTASNLSLRTREVISI